MKFDVVIGNPPYNDDMYLDFLLIGHKLSKDIDIWIVPGKWVSKSGRKNDIFRKDIVSRMQDIIFYPEASDIFDIALRGGITILRVGKDICKTSFITNKSSVKWFNTGAVNREIGDCLFNCALTVIDKVRSKDFKPLSEFFNFKKDFYLRQLDNVSEKRMNEDDIPVIRGTTGVCGYVSKDMLLTDKYLDQYKLTIAGLTGAATVYSDNKVLGLNAFTIINRGEIPKDGFPVLYASDSYDELVYIKSYLMTKFARFLFYVHVSSSSLAKVLFDFIPQQPVYDHIFTDSELYEKYGLDNSEITMIEEVMRDRS